MEFKSQQSRGAHVATRAANESDLGGANGRPNPEVEPKAKRRQFSAKYKLAILDEVAKKPGQVGAILRREGLYSSHLTSWRRQRREGSLKALASKKRGRKGKSAAELENEKLQRRVAQLERELEKANTVIDAQKKLAEILGITLPKVADNGSDESE